MKVYIDGNINQYYVQMLCMIFFPGAKFSQSEEEDGENPVLHLTYRGDDEGAHAYAKIYLGEKSAECERHYPKRDDITSDRLKKIAVGDAVISALSESACAKVVKHGIEDVFGTSAPAGVLLEHYGLNASGIVEKVKKLLNK